MERGDEIRQLLPDIRDTQRQHLAEYRQAAQPSLELPERALARQEQIGHLYPRLVLVGGTLVPALLTLLVYLRVRWSRHHFGIWCP